MALTAAAQDLKTEVVVDRTVEPAERAATRLGGLTPELVLPVFEPVAIKPSIYNRLSPLTRSFTRLDPSAGPAAAEPSPYRGYAAIGYFPTLNIGVTGGYRIVETERFSFGIDAGYICESYDVPSGYYEDSNSLMLPSVNLDFGWRPNSRSAFSASANYSFIRQSTSEWTHRKISAGGLNLGWKSSVGNLEYSAAVKGMFENALPAKAYKQPYESSGISQQQYGFEAEGSLPVGALSRFGVAVEGDFVHTGAVTSPPDRADACTFGTVGVKPFYAIATGPITARVGLKVDFATGGEGAKVHVAPDLWLQWAATPQFAVWADISGGDVVNSFSALRQITQYQFLTRALGRSDVPVAADLGFNFGPFSGFSAQLFGGYAVANEWLMLTGGVTTPWAATDVKGWHAGLRLGYEWRILSVNASAEFAPSDYDKVWFRTYDRASTIINASARVTPFSKFSIGAGYEFRGGRKAFSGAENEYHLGCVSNLSATADYKLSGSFTIFARVENLLSRRYEVVRWINSQGVHGLFGVEVKF